MKDLSKNEMGIVVKILKNPEKPYNATSIAKEIGISAMGALKILKRLRKENMLLSYPMGKAVFYKLNKMNRYVSHYLEFLLKREVEQAHPYIKTWAREIRKIKHAESAILFGSILRKQEKANDIDVLLVIDKKRFTALKKEIEEINSLNLKKIHPLYQTKNDVIKNIKEGDAVILNAIKGIVIFGENSFVEVLMRES